MDNEITRTPTGRQTMKAVPSRFQFSYRTLLVVTVLLSVICYAVVVYCCRPTYPEMKYLFFDVDPSLVDDIQITIGGKTFDAPVVIELPQRLMKYQMVLSPVANGMTGQIDGTSIRITSRSRASISAGADMVYSPRSLFSWNGVTVKYLYDPDDTGSAEYDWKTYADIVQLMDAGTVNVHVLD